jgi:hypothetical protein
MSTARVSFDGIIDRDNEIHYRGQGYVYRRALGMEPPPFWERQ